MTGSGHRSSTKATWSIPHFEKMLHHKAQLLAIYVEACRLIGDLYYRVIAKATADYLNGAAMAPEDGFDTAEDAAVNGKEGGSCLWIRQEIASVLRGEAACRLR